MVAFEIAFFCCPICRKTLEREGMRLVCESNHSFDIAAKGQVNLLRAFGSSHGDNADMVKARRQFLESGAYDPMRKAVAALLDAYMPKGGVLLDSGCGEGYYTEEFAKNPDRLVYGMNKYYGEEMGPSIWAGKKMALISTCGYPPGKGADLWEEGMRRYCKHSKLEFLGIAVERQRNYGEQFMDEEKEVKMVEFANHCLDS